MKKRIPVIKMSKLTYQLLAKKDVIGLRTRIFSEYGDIACYRIKGIRNIYIRNPEHIGQILMHNQENYLKRHPVAMESFCPFTGRGINFNNDPIEWRRDRASALMPLEPSIYFNDYSIQVVEKCKKMLQSWEEKYKQNDLINVEVEIGELILDITAATLFIHLDIEASTFLNLILSVVAAFKSKLQTPSFVWPFCKARKKYNEVLKTAFNVTNKMAMQRFEDPKAWDDIIGCFMNEFRDYDEAKLKEHVRDQIATLVSVGYFTTSGLIRWILVELSRRPDIARRLQEEIDSVIGQRAPVIEDLTKCVYLSAFIKEVLRLNPTLFGIMRQSNEMDELGDYQIEKEDGIIVSPYHVHRHPDYWTNPEGFEPERFLENSLGQSHPFAYIPFGAGMRNCIGSSFSTLEAKLITIMLLQRCRLYLEPHAEVKPQLTTLISMCPSVKNMRLIFTN